jgi:pimeloyl-ACP methyl ester carboxylesterase
VLFRSPLTSLKAQPDLRRAQVAPAADGGALLVLIHGTFVDTVSTFGKLWDEHPDRVKRLFDAYPQRVYALDHPTLGASPFANALTLVQALPQGARLHLLTHSRGGLVAEVLARLAGQRRIDPRDLEPFAGDGYQQQRDEMAALLAAIVQKDIHVERVVRVACPARGTLLASRRLDAYLSVLTWALKASGAVIAAEVLDFLNAVAERRTDPALIPGLEAMMPGSPLVQWLNRPDRRIPGDLRVVAGDLQGDSIGSWLKTLLSDAFYWTDNDIVVHTRSMYGGSSSRSSAHSSTKSPWTRSSATLRCSEVPARDRR